MTATGINGATYRLNPTPIGSGGEGDIYRISGTAGKVAKIYKPGAMSQDLEEKLKQMVSRPPNASVLSQVAWPLDVVYDNSGQCCGFVMPELEINAELGDVYKYPSTLPLSTQQKINIAQNICAVISEVHQAGYVFGDFNPRNIGLDINTGLVSFLDTDTYHVANPENGKTYRCNVCAPGYAAPELLEKCSDHVAAYPTDSRDAYAKTPLPTFTQETDNFALAIHIFKLLMNGYTPFGGIIETASVSQSSPGVGDAAVRRDSYCFKPGYKHQSAAIMPLEALPQEMADLFTRAFIVGKHDPRQRPNAAEWHGALTKYAHNLTACRDNPLHQYDRKNSKCPLCEADSRYAAVIGGTASPSLKQTTYAPPLTPQHTPTYSSIKAMPQSPPPQTMPYSGTVQPPAQNQRKAWHYILPSIAATVAVLAIILHGALPDGLGGLFAPTPQTPVVSNQQAAETPQNTPQPTPEPPPQPTTAVAIGYIIPFGNHNWRVLDVQGNQALIITENIISHRMFHHTFENVTWETSEIRQYLNSTFLNTFNEADRARIRETTVINNNNPWDWSDWGGHASTPGGNNTTDRIFLLSIDEVLQYFGDSGLMVQGATMGASQRANNEPQWPNHGIYGLGIHDRYSEARIARDSAGSVTWWWLRSPGFYPYEAAGVFYDGSLRMYGGNVFWSGGVGGGVRPALWLNLTP